MSFQYYQVSMAGNALTKLRRDAEMNNEDLMLLVLDTMQTFLPGSEDKRTALGKLNVQAEKAMEAAADAVKAVFAEYKKGGKK